MPSKRPYWVFPKCKEQECQNAAHGWDGWCRGCRLRFQVSKIRKYNWTPEMDAMLTRIYRTAKGKADLAAGIKDMCRRWGLPKHICSNRAQTLGLRIFAIQPWTKEEVAQLEEWAGTRSIYSIAKSLGRSESSVKCKAFMLGLSCDVQEGFSRQQLRELMGVSMSKVIGWVNRGWLETDEHDRIPHKSVEAFLWDHMEDYRFSACEEWWLKQMLKPTNGLEPVRRTAA